MDPSRDPVGVRGLSCVSIPPDDQGRLLPGPNSRVNPGPDLLSHLNLSSRVLSVHGFRKPLRVDEDSGWDILRAIPEGSVQSGPCLGLVVGRLAEKNVSVVAEREKMFFWPLCSVSPLFLLPADSLFVHRYRSESGGGRRRRVHSISFLVWMMEGERDGERGRKTERKWILEKGKKKE